MQYYNRDPQPFTGGMPGGFGGQMPRIPQSYPFGQDPPPFGQGFQPPFGPPPSGGGATGTGPPPGPPPSFVPSQAAAHQAAEAFAINPGAIRRCLFRYVYIWLDNGQQFWAWLVFVGTRSIAGWRWIGFRWVYFGIDLNRISSFICY